MLRTKKKTDKRNGVKRYLLKAIELLSILILITPLIICGRDEKTPERKSSQSSTRNYDYESGDAMKFAKSFWGVVWPTPLTMFPYPPPLYQDSTTIEVMKIIKTKETMSLRDLLWDLADVDGDKDIEIIGLKRIFDHKGNLLLKWNPADFYIRDGYFYGTDFDHYYAFPVTITYNGRKITLGFYYGIGAIYDIDGDGVKEIIAYAEGLTLVKKETKASVWYEIPESDYKWTLDRYSEEEKKALGFGGYPGYIKSYLVAIDGVTGKVDIVLPLPPGGTPRSAYDLDGDGNPELFIDDPGTYGVYDLSGKRIFEFKWWIFNSLYQNYLLGDFDRDGCVDLFVAGCPAAFTCKFDLIGTFGIDLYIYDFEKTFGRPAPLGYCRDVVAQAFIGNFLGRGKVEMLRPGGEGFAEILAFDIMKYAPIGRGSYYSFSEYSYFPTDFDGDGQIELIAYLEDENRQGSIEVWKSLGVDKGYKTIYSKSMADIIEGLKRSLGVYFGYIFGAIGLHSEELKSFYPQEEFVRSFALDVNNDGMIELITDNGLVFNLKKGFFASIAVLISWLVQTGKIPYNYEEFCDFLTYFYGGIGKDAYLEFRKAIFSEPISKEIKEEIKGYLRTFEPALNLYFLEEYLYGGEVSDDELQFFGKLSRSEWDLYRDKVWIGKDYDEPKGKFYVYFCDAEKMKKRDEFECDKGNGGFRYVGNSDPRSVCPFAMRYFHLQFLRSWGYYMLKDYRNFSPKIIGFGDLDNDGYLEVAVVFPFEHLRADIYISREGMENIEKIKPYLPWWDLYYDILLVVQLGPMPKDELILWPQIGRDPVDSMCAGPIENCPVPRW